MNLTLGPIKVRADGFQRFGTEESDLESKIDDEEDGARRGCTGAGAHDWANLCVDGTSGQQGKVIQWPYV